MRKMTVPLAFAAAASLITVAVMLIIFSPASFLAQTRPVSSYAEDRAAIEDLQARYLFALEDEMVKADGKWLFTKRKIVNEGREEWAYKGGKNPAW